MKDAIPDQEEKYEMEQAINLPKTAQGSARSMSVAEAMEAGFLPALDEDQADMFTPLELRLYRHAPSQDHRLLTGICWVIPVYLVISLACQLDDSCPVTAQELLHITV